MQTVKWLMASITLTAGLAVRVVSISPVSTRNSPFAGIPGGERQRVLQAYGELPLVFEAGDAEVKFFSRGVAYNMFLTETGAVLSNGVRINLRGANPAPLMEGSDRVAGVSHYIAGNDPMKWRTGVPRYARVRYRAVYPGVDLLYYGNQQNIEHDFVVAPGADPHQIRFTVAGANRVDLDGQGDLVIGAAEGEVRLRKPEIYQNSGNRKRQIAGQYVLAAGGEVSFEVGDYDRALPLVIDPVLVYSTYLGGSSAERFAMVAADDAGNAYVVGSTMSLDFPVMNALQPKHGGLPAENNLFVTKLNAEGTLVFSTYLGGGSFQGGFIAIGGDGNLYVASSSNSATDFPVSANAYQRTYAGGGNDVWIGKLSPDGSKLLYGTHLGGSSRDRLLALAPDAAGNVVLAGETRSSDFPTAAPVQPNLAGLGDGFVAKLSPDGSKLIYSTYLGGSGDDRAFAVTLDAQGSAYIVGRTPSADFPVLNAVQKNYGGGPDDGFLVKLSADGKMLFSTFLGGAGDDAASGIARDAAGNIYVTGATNSVDFPVKNAIQSVLGGGTCGTPARLCLDAYVTRLSPDGSAILYSTYFGGSGDDNVIEDTGIIAVDARGYAYIAGVTTSIDLPTFNAIQPAYGGGAGNAFAAALTPDGASLVFATYLGGSLAEAFSGLAVDNTGNVYISGHTSSLDFPTANAVQRNYGGGATDAFVAKIGPASPYFAVSAANRSAPLAAESLASLYGTGLAKDTTVWDPKSPGTSLGGIGLRVRDSNGVTRLAPLLYVSPSQINFEVPDGTAPGNATLEVVNAVAPVPPVGVTVHSSAPGIFTLQNNTAAAYGVRVEENGTQTVLSSGTPIVIDTRTVDLVLFGTGIRYRSSLAGVKVTIGGTSLPVEYAGPGGGVPGLDQVNVRLTAALKGNTDGRLVLSVDGVVANVVRVDVR